MNNTTIAREEIEKICTICKRKGHWAQEHEIYEEMEEYNEL